MKTMAKKLISIIIILATCTGAIHIYKTSKKQPQAINPSIVQHFNLRKLDPEQANDKNYFIDWINQEEKAVWQEIESALNLTYDQCQKLKKNDIKQYQEASNTMRKNYESGEKVSQDTINFIHGIMKEFGVNKETVSIVAWNVGSAAAATDNFIFVNEKILNNLEPQAKKFAIGHELIHLIKGDHSTNYFVQKQKPVRPLNANDSENPINKIQRLQEFRADILASLQGIDFAKGNILFFKKHLEQNGEVQRIISHPKCSSRLKIGEKIARLV